MEVDDLMNCLMMHSSSKSNEVIIVIDGENYKLNGTIIGDEDENAVFVYAVKER